VVRFHRLVPLAFLMTGVLGCGGGNNGVIIISPSQTPTATPTPTAVPTPPSPFSPTGNMASPRKNHTATILADGEVLIAGGSDNNGSVPASAELYDPTSGTFTATGAMNDAREFHTAALLGDGQVLIAGGQNNSGTVLATTELYDPAKGTFAVTTKAFPATGTNMSDSREFHTATALADGQVLIAGGQDNGGTILATAELYDPLKGSFTTTTDAFPGTGTNMTDSRISHTATLFTGGPLTDMVLVAGGLDNASVIVSTAELYDPADGSFTATGALTVARENHTATLLSNQQVLIAGGFGTTDVLSSAELYSPATRTFAATGSMSDQRQFATATSLASGIVLVAGGANLIDVLASADLFDPSAGGFRFAGGVMTDSREDFTGTLLESGKILLAGEADDSDETLATAELYTP
jgi:Galactose oxidase, central domain